MESTLPPTHQAAGYGMAFRPASSILRRAFYYIQQRPPPDPSSPTTKIWLSELTHFMNLEKKEDNKVPSSFTWDQEARCYNFIVSDTQLTLPWWIGWTSIPSHLEASLALSGKNSVSGLQTNVEILDGQCLNYLHSFLSHEPMPQIPVDLIFRFFFYAEELKSSTLSAMALLLLPSPRNPPIDGQFTQALKLYVQEKRARNPVTEKIPNAQAEQRQYLREWLMAYVWIPENWESLNQGKFSLEFLDDEVLGKELNVLRAEAKRKWGERGANGRGNLGRWWAGWWTGWWTRMRRKSYRGDDEEDDVAMVRWAR